MNVDSIAFATLAKLIRQKRESQEKNSFINSKKIISGHCFEVVSYVDLKNLSNTKSVLRARHLLKVKRSIGQSLNYNWLNGSIYVDKNLFLIVAPLFVLTSYPFILCSVYIATEKNL